MPGAEAEGEHDQRHDHERRDDPAEAGPLLAPARRGRPARTRARSRAAGTGASRSPGPRAGRGRSATCRSRPPAAASAAYSARPTPIRSRPIRATRLPTRMTSCRSGDRTMSDARAWRMSPTGGGVSRSFGRSEGRGLVATETLILLPGRRIPASEEPVERHVGSDVDATRGRARRGRSGGTGGRAARASRRARDGAAPRAGRCRGSRRGRRRLPSDGPQDGA